MPYTVPERRRQRLGDLVEASWIFVCTSGRRARRRRCCRRSREVVEQRRDRGSRARRPAARRARPSASRSPRRRRGRRPPGRDGLAAPQAAPLQALNEAARGPRRRRSPGRPTPRPSGSRRSSAKAMTPRTTARGLCVVDIGGNAIGRRWRGGVVSVGSSQPASPARRARSSVPSLGDRATGNPGRVRTRWRPPRRGGSRPPRAAGRWCRRRSSAPTRDRREARHEAGEDQRDQRARGPLRPAVQVERQAEVRSGRTSRGPSRPT